MNRKFYLPLKFLVIFVVLCAGGYFYLHYEVSKNYGVPLDDHNFVILKDNKFFHNDEVFFPVALNYIVALNIDGSKLWVSPSHDYVDVESDSYSNRDSALKHLQADMDLIKQSGFNTVRVVGIGEMKVHDYQTGELKFPARTPDGKEEFLYLMKNNNQQRYFEALEELFKIAEKSGLKIIFLNKMLPDVNTTEKHLKELAYYFRADTCILAYDLFNEPLYFDLTLRPKQTVYRVTNRWKNIIRNYAPNHLVTIGLVGIREVFAWDPNIVNVDFISFHPYEHEPEQVRNEILWYQEYVNKPWIIGETAIPADNDSVSYDLQQEFAKNAIKQSVSCGAIGFSWWQFKDVKWAEFHASFMGIYTREGETLLKNSNETVSGTAKPVINEFLNFNYSKSKGECVCLPNYYNYSMNTKFSVTGKIVDQDEHPVEGAVILAWNKDWTHSYHTITQKDGSFDVRSNYPFYHLRMSATNYSVIADDILPDTARVAGNGIPTISMGVKMIRKEF